MEKTKLSEMEKGIIDLLKGDIAVWIPDRNIDMSVFAEYPKEKEGIAVYYPVFKDGSCAEPVYLHFYRNANGMSLDVVNVQDYRMQEKERLGYLLRR